MERIATESKHFPNRTLTDPKQSFVIIRTAVGRPARWFKGTTSKGVGANINRVSRRKSFYRDGKAKEETGEIRKKKKEIFK